MNRIKLTFALILTAGLWLGACTKDTTEGGGEVVYSGKSTTTYISSEAGTYDFEIKTSGAWSATPVNFDTKQWVSFESKSQGTGKGTLKVYCRANSTFAREGRIAIKLAEAPIADTIIIRQYGIQPQIEFVKSSANVYPVGGQVAFEWATNITGSSFERITASATTPTGEPAEWVTVTAMASKPGEKVTFKVEANTTAPRQANLRLTFKDDWGLKHDAICLIEQASMGNPEVKSFAQIRALVTEQELDIDQNYVIEGHIISDCNSGNNASNPNTTKTAIDYTKNKRTAYIQSMDGAYGFEIVFENEEQNIFQRYDHVTFSLNGAKVTKALDPERYTLTNVSENSIFGHEPGKLEDLPLKEKYIAELTAEDLYTRVTLKDCEYPIRIGSYTPINEGYGSAYNTYRLDMYPLVVRDSKGGLLHVMTNIKAPWRRDGKALPQGAGKLSGVVVKELYKRFEQDGNIGPFQIRAIEASDIALERESRKAYTTIIAAWDEPKLINSMAVRATIGSGEITHSSGTALGTANGYITLGPINGTSDGKGVSSGTSWKHTTWWDTVNNCGEGWIAKFSTDGISAKHVGMTFSVLNQTIGAPRYWAVEWSDHGQKLGTWNRVAEYTVPDVVQWGNTLEEHSAGHKNISFELPKEILGKQNVYIRLIPTSTKAGTTTSYDGGTYSGSKEQHMSYLAIYYNN